MFYYKFDMNEIYLDWAATAPADPEVLDRMSEVGRSIYGNPSSTHRAGKAARKHIEESRRTAAELLDTSPDRIVFTSGGSESSAIPLLSLLRKKRRGRILISSIEHPAVWETISLFTELGYEIIEIPPDSSGIVQPEQVSRALSPDTIAAAVMAVNNETGAIQPVADIGRLIREYEKKEHCSILFHCDMVQALGKIPIAVDKWQVDTAAFSAHKLGGPRGIGILYRRRDLSVLFSGGGQEDGLRPGTENTAGIAGFCLAMQKHIPGVRNEHDRAGELADRLIQAVQETDGCRLLPESRSEQQELFSPYIVSFSVAPVPGEVFTRVLNDRSILIGSGSACSSNRQKKHARVLHSMGVNDEVARGAVRVSIGYTTTMSEIETFIHIMREELKTLQTSLGHA